MRTVMLGAIGAIVVVAALGVTYYYESTAVVNVYSTTGNNDPIYLTVGSIMIHSKSGSWQTISNVTKTVMLSGNLTFLAGGRVPAGNYTEVRLLVSSATIEVAGVNVTVSVPSSVLKIPVVPSGLIVKGGNNPGLELLFGPHVVQTGDGKYILSPVVVARQIKV